jgi:hypothetical protein
MSRTDLAWLAVAAYALHIMEERMLDWLGSARKSLDLTIEQDNYRLIEAVFLILGAVAAMVSASLPIIALSFAGFLLVNAIFFHLWPMVRTGGQFSPGVITAVILFLPIAYYQYRMSASQPADYVLSLIIGAAVILSPLALMKLRENPSFWSGGSAASGGAAGASAKPKRGRK